MKRKKEKEIIEQQEITDAIRGPEVKKEDRSESTVEWLLMTIQLPLINKIIQILKCEPAAPQTFLYKINLPINSKLKLLNYYKKIILYTLVIKVVLG